MSKAPRAGLVKTRLVPPLTPEEAAALNVCFLRDMTANIAGVARSGGADGVAVYTPVGAESAFDGLLPEGFSLLAQRGARFGDRLFHAAEDLTARVLRQTIERAAEINLAVELLPAWYDVDEASSLRRLCRELFAKPANQDGRNCHAGYAAAHTRDYLARLIGAEGRSRIWPEAQAQREQKA